MASPRAGEPFLHPARAGIVGRRGKPEIAELAAQLGQEFGRLRQRLHGIEGIKQAALAGGPRHELRDSLRALAVARHRSDRIGLEPALLPDQAGKEFQRQAVRPRRPFDHQADRLGGADVGGGLQRGLRDGELFDARNDATVRWRVLGSGRDHHRSQQGRRHQKRSHMDFGSNKVNAGTPAFWWQIMMAPV